MGQEGQARPRAEQLVIGKGCEGNGDGKMEAKGCEGKGGGKRGGKRCEGKMTGTGKGNRRREGKGYGKMERKPRA